MKVGIDVGFGFTKFKSEEIQNKFPSVVGEHREVKFDTGMKKKGLIDNLVVEMNGEKHFIGDLANRQSNITLNTLSKNRIDTDENKVLFKAALALLANKNNESFELVTGLPVNEFDSKNKLKAELLGNHSIKIVKGSLVEHKNINIENVIILPQPFGGLFDQTLNESGEIYNKQIAKGKVAVIDIGFRTSDYIVAENMEYIDKLSTSSTTGMSNAYKMISDKMKEEYNIDIPVYKMEKYIRNKKIPYKNENIIIDDLINKTYNLIAKKIISEVHSLWENWEMFDKILLAGGGGAALYKYIKQHIDNCILVDRSQFSNVSGYLKLANRTW